MITSYAIDNWFKLQKHEESERIYSELKLLGRRYWYYMALHMKALHELRHILDYLMLGLKKMFVAGMKQMGKTNLATLLKYSSFDLIT